jgi:hypothetical protein
LVFPQSLWANSRIVPPFIPQLLLFMSLPVHFLLSLSCLTLKRYHFWLVLKGCLIQILTGAILTEIFCDAPHYLQINGRYHFLLDLLSYNQLTLVWVTHIVK